MADLVVELYSRRVGVLRGTDWRTFDFVIDPEAFEHFEIGSRVMSESVPLDAVPIRRNAAQRRNFFAELLPEGQSLEDAARRARVSTNDALGMLRAYGRDIAGAIQIWDPELPGEPRSPQAQELSDAEVETLLSHLSASPLGNRMIGGKSSLAGVQPKAVLAFCGSRWHQVIDGYPSTHILKPELGGESATMIYDEEYGARFARALGLADYSSELMTFNSTTALVIERYDRGEIYPDGRLHQEDMNQALGVHASGKYQELGDGGMTLRRIARIFSRRGDRDSLRRLLVANVLAVCVGNLDMHGKNLSILHFPDGSATLAPCYDVVPQAHRPDSDGRLAIAINGKYGLDSITLKDLVDEARGWGIPEERAHDMVMSALVTVKEVAAAEEPHPRAWKGLRKDIEDRAGRLQEI